MPRRAVRRPTRSRSTSPRRRPTRDAVNAVARSRSGPSPPLRRGAVALSLPCILYPRLLASHTHAERRPAAGDARVVVVVLILTLPFPLPPVVQRRGVHIINASPYLRVASPTPSSSHLPLRLCRAVLSALFLSRICACCSAIQCSEYVSTS